MQEGWLPEKDWRTIQLSVPITCVDVLITRKGVRKNREVGLILRETPHQGRRWCLIGGRLLLNEPFQAAIIRQVRQALGPKVKCVPVKPLQPLFVAEYLTPRVQRGSLFDPRQHAVALTFSAQIRGTVKPTGEALDFQWFHIGQLPKQSSFGFGQGRVVAECIRRLDKG